MLRLYDVPANNPTLLFTKPVDTTSVNADETSAQNSPKNAPVYTSALPLIAPLFSTPDIIAPYV